MHQASVGFHCPECTKQSGQKVIRASQLRTKNVVTNVLIAINAAVFVAGIGSGLSTKDQFVEDGGLIANAVDRSGHLIGVANGQWYRIISSGFLHENIVHIGLNMWVLYLLGQLLEPVLGRLRFALVYVVAMLAGGLGVLVLAPNQLTVGASGAIFGLMGAAVAVMRSRGINPFATGIGTTILLNLLITFTIPNISIGGHIGGLIGGFVAGWLLVDLPPSWNRNPAVPIAALVAVGAVLVGACLVVA
jgi:membrane associated rhomboid family serine protease